MINIKQHQRFRYSVILLAIITGLAIWMLGPSLHLNGKYPLHSLPLRSILVTALAGLTICFFFINGLYSLWKKEKSKSKLLTNRFFDAVKFLKNTVINASHGKVSLNTLPWHLVIGPHGSGKTTLLTNAEIPYVLSRHSKHIVPSKQCGWWVSNKIIVLETPGNYLTKSGQRLWQTLLKLLKSSCKETGIRSIMLVIDTTILNNEKETFHLIANRILSLQKTLSYTVPVYLIINQCDKIPGYLSFFSHISQEERQEAWGFLLDDPDNTLHTFNKKFEDFTHNLQEQLVWRLQNETDLGQRLSLLEFPSEMKKLETPLKNFTQFFLKEGHGKRHLIDIKGIFFCSACQAPNAAAIATLTNPASPPSSKVHFFHDLIADYFPNQPILNQTYPKNLSKNSVLLIAITTIAVFAGLWAYDLKHHLNTLSTIEQSIIKYQAFTKKEQNPTLNDIVTPLGQLLNAWNILYKEKYVLPLSKNLFKNNGIETILASQLQPAIFDYFLPSLTLTLTSQLTHDLQTNDASAVYLTLKAYLMIYQSQTFNAEFLTRTINRFITTPMTDTTTHSLFQLIYMDTSSSSNINDALVQRARHFLAELPPIQMAFILLRDEYHSGDLSPAINLQKNTWLALNNTDNFIPIIYTAKTFSDILKNSIPHIAQTLSQEHWILGEKTQSPLDEKTLVSNLTKRYLAAYINAWGLLISRIETHHPQTIQEAANYLNEIINTQAPFIKMLRSIQINTNFNEINKINPTIKSLNQLLNDQGEPSETLNRLFNQLNALNIALTNIIDTDNRADAAVAFTTSRILSADKAYQLVSLIDTTDIPEPVQSWLEQLSTDIWTILIKTSIAYVHEVKAHTPLAAQAQTSLDAQVALDPQNAQDIQIILETEQTQETQKFQKAHAKQNAEGAKSTLTAHSPVQTREDISIDNNVIASTPTMQYRAPTLANLPPMEVTVALDEQTQTGQKY